jgi:hypothetical protein
MTVSPERKNGLEETGRDLLPGLKKQLSEEYEGQSEGQIDEAAKHGLDRLAGAKIRGFVGIFAWRHASKHLRRASWGTFTWSLLGGPDGVTSGG